MPIWVILTQGRIAGCTQATHLIEEIEAEQLLADRGYDSDAILN